MSKPVIKVVDLRSNTQKAKSHWKTGIENNRKRPSFKGSEESDNPQVVELYLNIFW